MEALNHNKANLFNRFSCGDDVCTFFASNYTELVIKLLQAKIELTKVELVGESINFRGIDYKKDMIVCVEKDEFGFFHLCQIQYIFINTNLEHFIIFGKKKKL